MKTWKLRSCPRCRGDIFLDTDEEHRWYETCLQCGYIHELKKLVDITEYAGAIKKKLSLA